MPAETRRRCIVFSGNMEYHPNRAAVRFFRREVWPGFANAGLIWSGGWWGRTPKLYAPFTAGDPRIEVSGEVEDAIAEIGARPGGRGSAARRQRHAAEDSGGLGGRHAGGLHDHRRGGSSGAQNGQHLLLADGAAGIRRRRWSGYWRAQISAREPGQPPADCCWKRSSHGKKLGGNWPFDTAVSRFGRYTGTD